MPTPAEQVPPRTGRSSRSCRERAELLLLAAEAAPEPAAAVLRAQALEWRKLAIEAAWQEAYLTALDSLAEPDEEA